jgi:hypothetical protein
VSRFAPRTWRSESVGSWTKAVVGMSAAIARTAVEGMAVGREGSWERILRDLCGLFVSMICLVVI